MEEPRRILVVKLGALGNIVLSMGPFANIRRHHPTAHITLLTTAPYADWTAKAPYFDTVWIDDRPDWWNVPGWLRLRRRLIGGHFDRVYDLQTSSRSSRYFQLWPRRKRPEWSGIARGCSFPDSDPDRDRLYDIDRQYGQLRQAGIEEHEPIDLSWLHGNIARFELPRDFALLAPGSAPHRLAKRWPVGNYTKLAAALVARGLTPVIVGGIVERPLAKTILTGAPGAIDLTRRTSFGDLASLGRAACVAIGNDTGPMHLFSAVECPSIVLFSHDSDPALCAPCGPSVEILQRPHLDQLGLSTVLDAVAKLARTEALATG
jgi:ADP-heptose:LPS heptosyltransferase